MTGKQLKNNRNPVKKKFECPLCHLFIPDAKTMQIHWDSKHSKLPFVLENCVVGGKDESDEKESPKNNNNNNKNKNKSKNNKNNPNNKNQGGGNKPKSKSKSKGGK